MFGDEKADIGVRFVDGRAIFVLTKQGWKVSATAAGTKYWAEHESQLNSQTWSARFVIVPQWRTSPPRSPSAMATPHRVLRDHPQHFRFTLRHGVVGTAGHTKAA